MFQKIKKVFGFATETEEDEEQLFVDDEDNQLNAASSTPVNAAPSLSDCKAGATAEPTPDESRTQSDILTETLSSQDQPKEDPADKTDNKTAAASLFDEVRRLFHQYEPQCVSECLDTVIQRRCLYQSLEAELRSVLGHEEGEAAAKESADSVFLRKQTSESNVKVDELETRIEELQKACEEKELEISRLTYQISEKAATIDQPRSQNVQDPYDISGFPIVIADSSTDDVDSGQTDEKADDRDFISEIEKLQSENENLKSDLTATQGQLTTATEELESANKEASIIKEEVYALKENIETLKGELTLSHQRYEESETNLTDIKNKLDERDSTIARLETSLADSDRRIEALENLNQELRKKNTELEEIRKKRDVMVAEANAKTHRLISDNQQKGAQFQTEINRLNSRVSELESVSSEIEKYRSENQQLRNSLEESAKATDTLKTEIETLKTKVTETEGKYNAAMEGLREQPTEPLATKRKRGRPRKEEAALPNQYRQNCGTPKNPAVAAEPQFGGYADPDSILQPEKDSPVREEATAISKRKVKPDVSSIDELLNGADWMESPTPSKRSAKKPKNQEDDDDFGYKAPPQRHHPDNDAQMSLW